MPIPSCHLARKSVVYVADDGTRYKAKFESAALVHSAMAAPGSGDSGLPTLPMNIKPRHYWIETTNGEDAAGKYHVYRRAIPADLADLVAGQAGADGFVWNGYEGCNWVTRGYIGEKTYAR